MPVSPTQSTITGVTVSQGDGTTRVTWTSTEPAGTWFQVYLGGRLAWSGTARSCVLATPAASRPVPGAILAVPTGQQTRDFASLLPAQPGGGSRAVVRWLGGAYLGDVSEYLVYRSAAAGGSVSYAAPVAIVPARPGGDADGAGLGPAGEGGAGDAATVYEYGEVPPGPGAWKYGVKARDYGGALSAAIEFTVNVAMPPLPPPPFADRTRLHGSYNAGTRVLTLTWQASSP